MSLPDANIYIPAGTPVKVTLGRSFADYVRHGFGFSLGVAGFVSLACGVVSVVHWLGLA